MEREKYVMNTQTIDELLNQSIAAYRAGNLERSSELLANIIRQDPDNERAWIWVSGIVTSDAERLFCMKKILTINPKNEVALYGLTLLSKDLVPVQPSFEKEKDHNREICTFPGCRNPVTKPGFKYCYKHWQAVNVPREALATLTATNLGEKFSIPSRRMNLVLAELGWIKGERKGWVPTEQGGVLGATEKVYDKTGIPYVLWPDTILKNKALQATIESLEGTNEEKPEKVQQTFREKFTPKNRATDGHWVRSRAEMLIDNWLYMSGIIHAYERRLPIEEEVYCDFYIPDGKVYIEYWGMEKDPKYAARKQAKIEIYQKNHLDLIEITDSLLKNLDDYLPKALLRYSVIVS
jgi:hypothetical protein